MTNATIPRGVFGDERNYLRTRSYFYAEEWWQPRCPAKPDTQREVSRVETWYSIRIQLAGENLASFSSGARAMGDCGAIVLCLGPAAL